MSNESIVNCPYLMGLYNNYFWTRDVLRNAIGATHSHQIMFMRITCFY